MVATATLLAHGGMPFLVDPNSKMGLQLEGWRAQKRGRERTSNPYTKSHPRSLAEQHWFEGFDGAAEHGTTPPRREEETTQR